MQVDEYYQTISNDYPTITSFEAFIGGIAVNKSRAGLKEVFKTILDISNARSRRTLTFDQYLELMSLILDGNLPLAKGRLIDYSNSLIVVIRQTEELLQLDMTKLLQEEEQRREMDRLVEEDKQTQALIHKLMDEENKKAEANRPPVILCHLCKVQVLDENLCYLDVCAHPFHKACIVGFLTVLIRQEIIPLRNPCCNLEISVNDINNILPRADVNAYQALAIQQEMKRRTIRTNCPNPRCKETFGYTEDMIEYSCPVCRKDYCLICGEGAHPGAACGEAEEEVHVPAKRNAKMPVRGGRLPAVRGKKVPARVRNALFNW